MIAINRMAAGDAIDDELADFDAECQHELEPIAAKPKPAVSLVELNHNRQAKPSDDEPYEFDDTDEREQSLKLLERDENNLAALFAAKGFKVTTVGILESQPLPVSFIATKPDEDLAIVVALTNSEYRLLADVATFDEAKQLSHFHLAGLTADAIAAAGIEQQFRRLWLFHADILHYIPAGMAKRLRIRTTPKGHYERLLDPPRPDRSEEYRAEFRYIVANNEMLTDAFLSHDKTKEYKELSLNRFPLPTKPPKLCLC